MRAIRKISALLMLAMGVAVCPVHADAAPKVIKVDASVNTTNCPQYLAFMEMKKYIEERSNGRYRVDVYDSGKLGSPATVLQSMKMGTVHIAMESAANVSSFLPVLGVLDSPFLFMNSDEANRVLVNNPFGLKMLDPLNKVGIKPIGFAPSTFRWMLMKEPIYTVNDIKGQKVRATASRIDRENLKAMGFSPAAVTGPEMLSALQQGTIDGVALPADSVPSEKSVAEIARYAMGFEHCYMASVLSCSARWFKNLPAEDQKLMMDAMHFMIQTHGRMVAEISSASAIKDSGLYKEVIVTSPELKAELVARTAGVYDTLPEDWKPVVEEIRTLIKETANNGAK